MAQGDLFDVSMGGHGFHITAHLVALAALFIACFAIAGYVLFRKNSVPDKSLKDGTGLALPGVERRAYSYTYPAITAEQIVTGNRSIGPFTAPVASDGSSKLSLVSAEVSQSSAQQAALGNITIRRNSVERCAPGGNPNDDNSFTMFDSLANTADSTYERRIFKNSQAIGTATGNVQLCLEVQNAADVTAGAITVKYVLEHGPGGSFPPLLTTGTHTIIG